MIVVMFLCRASNSFSSISVAASFSSVCSAHNTVEIAETSCFNEKIEAEKEFMESMVVNNNSRCGRHVIVQYNDAKGVCHKGIKMQGIYTYKMVHLS
jgi:hypothetical protein